MHVFISQEDVDDMCLVNHVVVTLRHDEFLFNLWSLLALWWQRLPPHGNNVWHLDGEALVVAGIESEFHFLGFEEEVFEGLYHIRRVRAQVAVQVWQLVVSLHLFLHMILECLWLTHVSMVLER